MDQMGDPSSPNSPRLDPSDIEILISKLRAVAEGLSDFGALLSRAPQPSGSASADPPPNTKGDARADEAEEQAAQEDDRGGPQFDPGIHAGQGYVLLADMVDSTKIKSVAFPNEAPAMVAEHNRIVIDACYDPSLQCHPRLPKTIGDAVFAIFDARQDGALQSCLRAAGLAIERFRATPPIQRLDYHDLGAHPNDKKKPLRLRTKITLHYFEDCREFSFQTPTRSGFEKLEEIVGKELDLAFRISAIGYRMQIIATEAFMKKLACQVELIHPLRRGKGNLTLAALIEEATKLRDMTVMWSEDDFLNFEGRAFGAPIWITDARRITQLKGIDDPQDVCLISLTDPRKLPPEDHAERRIKLEQAYHAVIMVNASMEPRFITNYIDAVRDVLEPVTRGPGGDEKPDMDKRLDSELTLCVAAKIYGAYDFFFRVSCCGDLSLKRFFRELQTLPTYNVDAIDIRQTVRDRFWVNRSFDTILNKYEWPRSAQQGEPPPKRSCMLLLTWFEQHVGMDLFQVFYDLMREDEGKDEPAQAEKQLHILEAGEVIHHTPIYTLTICDSLIDYEEFLTSEHLNNTKTTTHIVHTPEEGFCLLRYHLVKGIFIPDPYLYT